MTVSYKMVFHCRLNSLFSSLPAETEDHFKETVVSTKTEEQPNRCFGHEATSRPDLLRDGRWASRFFCRRHTQPDSQTKPSLVTNGLSSSCSWLCPALERWAPHERRETTGHKKRQAEPSAQALLASRSLRD